MHDRHTFSTICIIRKNRSDSKADAAIYLRITVDGIRAEMPTKQFIEPGPEGDLSVSVKDIACFLFSQEISGWHRFLS
jgi:hypothetical protein